MTQEGSGDTGIDAILFLPGMGEAITPQPIDGIAQRIARALDFEHQDESRKFSAKSLPNLKYGQNQPREAEASRVIELIGTEARPVYDLYKVDYRQVLYAEGSVRGLRANLTLALGLFSFFFRWIKAWFTPRRGLSWRKQIQLFIGGVVVFLATSTLLALVVAAVSTIPWALRDSDALEAVSCYLGWLDGFYAAMVAAVGLSLLRPGNLRGDLDRLVGRMLALQAYLQDDHRREAVQAQVRNALEAIAESPRGYRQIIFMGYSFGSLVALDATLLRGEPDARVRKYVKQLVTIGCPATFIRTYWRGFFDKPTDDRSTKAIRWINAYTPADVLGSQFMVEGTDLDGQSRPNEEFAYPEALKRGGGGIGWVNAFASHALYWEPNDPDQPAVFSPIVRALEAQSQRSSL